jgi:hypothetical protein
MNGAIPPLPQYIFMAWCLVSTGTPLPYPAGLVPLHLHQPATMQQCTVEYTCISYISCKLIYRINSDDDDDVTTSSNIMLSVRLIVFRFSVLISQHIYGVRNICCS